MLVYKFSTDCVMVEGALRSVIYDLTREEFDFFPNTFLTLFSEEYNIDKIKESLSIDDFDDFYEQHKFLLTKEYIFEISSNESDFFPNLDHCYLDASFINTISIEMLLPINTSRMTLLLEKVANWRVRHISIILKEKTKIKEVLAMLKCFDESLIIAISLYTIDNFSQEDYEVLFSNCFRLNHIHVFNSSVEKSIELAVQTNVRNINYSKNSITISKKSNAKPSGFINNFSIFREAQEHNVFFNKRIHINNKFNVFHSQNAKKIIGSLEDKSIEQVLESKTIQKLWFSSKTSTDICKNCEFRYMCIDDRIPIQRNDNSWYHETECNYNPYIAKWQSEDGYKTLKECGVSSNEDGFTLDEEKIKAIVLELYGEDI